MSATATWRSPGYATVATAPDRGGRRLRCAILLWLWLLLALSLLVLSASAGFSSSFFSSSSSSSDAFAAASFSFSRSSCSACSGAGSAAASLLFSFSAFSSASSAGLSDLVGLAAGLEFLLDGGVGVRLRCDDGVGDLGALDSLPGLASFVVVSAAAASSSFSFSASFSSGLFSAALPKPTAFSFRSISHPDGPMLTVFSTHSSVTKQSSLSGTTAAPSLSSLNVSSSHSRTVSLSLAASATLNSNVAFHSGEVVSSHASVWNRWSPTSTAQ
mmetsp:Transcript_47276/g.145834  ORF Transcript_47276/g.145834 Transcript_47276/m.145834 type:complete len:272 (-) Transcript_47276:351-1166(-)